MLRRRKGQSTLEYAIIIAAVIAALLALNLYMKKGVQGKLKESTDQIGRQFDPETFSSAWKSESSGTTVSTEKREKGTGATTSEITQAERATRGEYDDWGTKPEQHY